MTSIRQIWSEVHNRHAYYDGNGNRLPEICIVDLANIPQELSCFNVDEIVKIWEWIKDNIERMINSETEEFFLVSRKYVDIEIRLVSKIFSRLERFRKKILDQAIKELGLTNKENYSSNVLIEQDINKEQYSKILQRFQQDYKNYEPRKEHEDKISSLFMQFHNCWICLERN